MPDIFSILLLSILGSIIALLGGAIFLYSKFSDVLTKYSTPFTAGVLSTTALIGMLPEATHLVGETAFLIALLAIVGSYIFEELFCHFTHGHHKESHHSHSAIGLIVIGDTIHNFIDGVTIAITYLINPGLGVITAISTFLHEVPHEIGDFGIMLKNGMSKKRVLQINLISASFTILGAIFTYYTATILPQISGYLIAIAAGMFMYLGIGDFLPNATKDIGKKKALATLLLGVSMMILVFKAIPHSHQDHQEDQSQEIFQE